MPARVGRLHLHIAISERDRGDAAAIQRDVEKEHTPRVLRALARALEERFGPDAIVRVRSLSVRWEVTREQLAGAGESSADDIGRQLAVDLAASLGTTPRPDLLRPPADAGIVLFRDRAHARAVSLSFGEDRPWFDREGAPHQVWDAACEEGADAVRALLRWVDAIGAAPEALAVLPAEGLERVAAIVPVSEWPAAAAEVARTSGASPADASRGSTAADATRSSAPREEAAADRAAANRGRTPTERAPGPGAGESASATDRSSPRPEPIGRPDRRDHRHGDDQRPRDLRPRVEARDASPSPDAPPPLRDRRADARRVEPPAPVAEREEIATEFAGLFYLAGRVLELDIGEHLWCAGLREGRVLCHVARLLALAVADERARGFAASDPAPRLFGGEWERDRDPALDPVPEWAAAEVIDKTLTSLGIAMVRRHLAEPKKDELIAIVDRLAEILIAPPAAVGAGGPGDRALDHATAAPDETTRALVSHLAAALLHFTAARVGVDLAAATDADVMGRAVCARLFAVPGRIAIDPALVRVRLPMTAIDIDVRRAGLDFNPGHVPWLERVVQIDFEEAGRA